MANHVEAHVPRWRYVDGTGAIDATKRVCRLCGCVQVRDKRTNRWR